MRKYCIHFEPFLNSFKKKFVGIDLSFCSELLAPEEIVKILDEIFDMVDEHFRRWNCPLLHVLFYPHMRRIIENIGGVTIENILEVAPSYNDLVKYIPNLD